MEKEKEGEKKLEKQVATTEMIYDVDAAKLSLKTECIILALARLITNTRPMAEPSRIDPRHPASFIGDLSIA